MLEIKDILSLEQILENNKEVFSEELGLLKGVEVKLALNPEAPPIFCKTRPVPYAMRERVKMELRLRRLEKEGALEPIQFSNWAAPIVASDGKVRILVYLDDILITGHTNQEHLDHL